MQFFLLFYKTIVDILFWLADEYNEDVVQLSTNILSNQRIFLGYTMKENF